VIGPVARLLQWAQTVHRSEFAEITIQSPASKSSRFAGWCQKNCTLDLVELKGLQLRDSVAFSALWLSQRTFLIAVNSGKPCGKATQLQLHVYGNVYNLLFWWFPDSSF